MMADVQENPPFIEVLIAHLRLAEDTGDVLTYAANFLPHYATGASHLPRAMKVTLWKAFTAISLWDDETIKNMALTPTLLEGPCPYWVAEKSWEGLLIPAHPRVSARVFHTFCKVIVDTFPDGEE